MSIVGGTGKPKFDPEIYITVIADCGNSMFRKYQATPSSEFCRSFPIKVLLHDVLIKLSNLESFAEKLYDSLNEFERELVESRQKDLIYVQPGEAPPTRDVKTNNSDSSQKPLTTQSIQDSIPIKTRGGSIYNSLENGLFALGLLSKEFLPCVILITDGVATGAGSSEMVAKDFCRMFARDYVAFNIIQIGSRNGFYPGVNYAHVPDNEFVRFLAIATFGKLLYASDCRYMDPSQEDLQPPNFYHLHLIIRELNLSKLVGDNAWRTAHGGSIPRPVDLIRTKCLTSIDPENDQEMTIEEIRFPWVTYSKPPIVYQVLCGYRDYSMNIRLSDLLSTRLLEGYSLHSVQVSQKIGRPSKVEVILALPWLPNVTIFYTIRTTREDLDSPFLGPSQKHRIELNILAHRAFVLVFVNLQQVENTGIYENALHEKVVILHNYLKGICESDEHLKIVSSFNSRFNLSIISPLNMKADSPNVTPQPKSIGERRQRSPSFGNSPRQYWSNLSQLVLNKGLSFEEWSCDLIIRKRYGTAKNERPRSLAMKSLNESLGVWCSYSLATGVYMKLLFLEEADHIPNGVCFLRTSLESEHVCHLRIGFSNISIDQRSQIIEQVRSNVALLNVDGVSLFAICKKPMRQLLVKYGDERKSGRRKSANSPSTNAPISPFISELDLTTFTPVLRAYLRNRKWTWFSGLNEVMGKYFRGMENDLEINNLAFHLIYLRRLQEGFLPVHESILSTTFYLETTKQRAKKKNSPGKVLSQNDYFTCSIQFVLLKDFMTGNLITELWIEPVSTIVEVSDLSDLISYEYQEEFACWTRDIDNQDNQITDSLFTFLSLNLLAKSEDKTAKEIFASLQKGFGQINSKFNLDLVLDSSKKFSWLLFVIPWTKSQSGSRLELIDNTLSSELSITDDTSSYFTPLDVSLSSSMMKKVLLEESIQVLNFEFDYLQHTILSFMNASSFEEQSTTIFSYFFENSLSKLCNGKFTPKDFVDQRHEIETCDGSNENSKDDYLVAFKKFFESSLPASQAAEILISTTKDSQCFVKFITPEACLLLILPRSDRMTKRLINLAIFECVLPSLSDSILTQPSKKPFEPYRNTGRPSSTGGFKLNPVLLTKETFQNSIVAIYQDVETLDNQVESVFDKAAKIFVESLDTSHTEAIGNSVYFHLLSGNPVDSLHVDSFLGVCVENSIDIDITNFLNAETLLDDFSEDEKNTLNERFCIILGDEFRPVSTFSTTTSDAFYFFPALLAKISNVESRYRKYLEISAYPLFLKLFFSVVDSSGRYLKRESIKGLPTSYGLLPREVEILNIGTDSNPLASKDGRRAILHVCLLSLKHGETDETEKIEGFEIFKAQLECQERIKVSIESLVDEVVMSHLLKLPITESSVSLVTSLISKRRHIVDPLVISESQMDQLKENHISFENETPDFIINIPLSFVGGPDLGMPVMEKEFTALTSFEVTKYGDFAYVTDCQSLLSVSSDSNLEGLGIFSDDIETVPIKGNSKMFWMLLKFDETKSFIELFWFSQKIFESEREEIILNLIKKVFKCCRRVNILLLLQRLNETRLLSKLLIEPSLETEVFADLSDDEEVNSPVNKGIWEVGKFACKSILKQYFPLSWRLKPHSALSSVFGALHALSVSNRKNTFVYAASNGSIFFMTLSVHDEGGSDEALLTTEETKNSPSTMNDNLVEQVVSPHLGQKRTPVSIQTAFKSNESMLVLDVFGVDKPGREITEEFVNLIDSKLSNLLLQELGTFLARNSVNIKLLSSDVDFITSSKSTSKYFEVPNTVQSPFLFLMLLRQNLLGSFSSFVGSDFLLQKLELDCIETSNELKNVIQLSDLTFLYNCIPSRTPTPQEILLGQGIGCISILLLTAEGKTVISLPLSNLTNSPPNPVSFDKLIETLPQSNYSVWTQGSINIEALFQKIETSCQSSLMDYSIDIAVKLCKDSLPEIRNGKVESLEYLPEKAVNALGSLSSTIKKAKKTHTLQEFSCSVNVPQWILKEFIVEIEFILEESHPYLFPFTTSRLKTKDGEEGTVALFDPEGIMNDFQPKEHLIFGGLCEESSSVNNHKHMELERKSSVGSDVTSGTAPFTPTRKSFSNDDLVHIESTQGHSRVSSKNFGLFGNQLMRFPLDDIMQYPGHISALGGPELGSRSSFVLIYLESNKLQFNLYNCGKSFSEMIFGKILRSISWNNIRMQYLEKAYPRVIEPLAPWELRTASDGNESNFSANQSSMYSPSNDTLQSRAVDFIGTFIRQFAVKKPEGVKQTSDFRVARGMLYGNSDDVLPAGNNRSFSFELLDGQTSLGSNFPAVLQTVSFIHFARYPLLFSEQRDSVFTKNFVESLVDFKADSDSKIPAKWFRKFILNYLKDYVAYLQELGLEVEKWEERLVSQPFNSIPNSTTTSIPEYILSNSLAIETDVIYMKKVVEYNVLLLQIGISGLYVHINTFTINNSPFSDDKKNPKATLDPEFNSECDRIKSNFHLFSFTHDFHIKMFQTLLEDKENVNIPINLKETMNAFLRFNQLKTRYGQCRFIHQSFTSENSNKLSPSLLNYILKNPERYGFLPFQQIGERIGCFLTSKNPDFNFKSKITLGQKKNSSSSSSSSSNTSKPSSYSYILLIYPTGKGEILPDTSPLNASASSTTILSPNLLNEGKSSVNFFLMIVKNEKFPIRVPSQTALKLKNVGNENPLLEYLDGGFYVCDILKNAERKMENLIEQAIRYYSRDSLWKQLLEEESENSTIVSDSDDSSIPTIQKNRYTSETGAVEWSRLFLDQIEPNSRPLVGIDPKLADLVNEKDIDWISVLDYLKLLYKPQARELIDGGNRIKGGDDKQVGECSKGDNVKRRHLIIFNPKNSDYFVHFKLAVGPNPEDVVMVINAVSREGVSDEVEYYQVDEIVQAISCWLWFGIQNV